MIEHYLDGTPCECDIMLRHYGELGVIKKECPFVNGKVNGLCRLYNDSGMILQEYTMEEGKLNGIMKTIYSDDEFWQMYEGGSVFPYYELKMWETPYKNNKRHGIERGYWYHGTDREISLGCEIEWNNGNLVLQKIFHFNDNVAEITPFEEFRIEGVVRLYTLRGHLFQQIPFSNDKMHGERIIHHTKDFFEHNLFVGGHYCDVSRYPLGYKQRIPYVNGLKNGIETLYNHEGTLIRECSWKEGKQFGYFRVYDDRSGNLIFELEYINGLAEGVAKTYYNDGTLKEESLYVGGKQVAVSPNSCNLNEHA